ncbi:MAG: hypothetical protein ACRDHU_06125 [Actinomycetota bacterium]
MEPREVQVRCAILQTRAVLEAGIRQEQTNEQLVKATNNTAEQTQGLVKATFWVAGGSIAAALAAGAAAIITAVKS